MKTLAALSLSISVMALAGLSSVSAGATHASKPVIQMLPNSGPHSIVNDKNKNLITFHVNVQGVTMDARFSACKSSNVHGHGHIAVYLDHIPGDAWGKCDLTNIASLDGSPLKCKKNQGKTCGPAGSYAYTVEFNSAWCKLHTGNHNLVFALAQNNGVLYSTTKNPKFQLTVKYDKNSKA